MPCLRLPPPGSPLACPAVFLLAAPGLLVVLLLVGCSSKLPPVDVGQGEIREEFWPDGTLHVRRTVLRTDDGRQLNHGPLSAWHETGEPSSEGHWRQGRKHGHFVFWHKNGRKSKEFTWTNGLGNGVFTAWDAQGNQLRSELWRDGHKIEAAATPPAETPPAESSARDPAASVTPPLHPAS